VKRRLGNNNPLGEGCLSGSLGTGVCSSRDFFGSDLRLLVDFLRSTEIDAAGDGLGTSTQRSSSGVAADVLAALNFCIRIFDFRRRGTLLLQ
jgi:hypothetical protein